MTQPVAALVDATSHGDRSALARLLTIVEAGGPAAGEVLGSLPPAADVVVLGITGSPGAGKSTLTDQVVARLRARGTSVGVVAIDPSSPFTGGAILGDRVRMQSHDTDDGVFVRSMASRGELGGMSRTTPHAVRVLASAGFEWVIVETVGVGQVEVAVARTADTTVVVVTPGWGDAIQANKAGLLEVGDVFVVNKADRVGVDATVADLRGMLALGAPDPDRWQPPVVTTVATEGRGVDELLDAVAAHRRHAEQSGELARRRERRVQDELRGIVVEWVTKQVDDICSGPRFDSVVARVAAGIVDPYTAATELVADQEQVNDLFDDRVNDRVVDDERDAVGIERVGVVGAGLMGSGIAEVSARGGADVIVCETDPRAVEAGRERIEVSLARAVKGGKLDEAGSAEVLGRLRFTTDLDDLADRDLVIEAIIESLDEKLDLFGNVDKILENDDAIVASNTSSIPIMKLAMATGRPEKVLGLHFFNPVPVQHLVELIPCIVTSPEAADRAEEFVRTTMDKRVIRSQDRAGFIVNFLFVPYVLSAIHMLESGFASADDIDAGMVEGCSHPMGPLALADLIGLDTIKAVADSMYEEFKEPLYASPPLLSRMVEAGLLGRKRGRGFFNYAK